MILSLTAVLYLGVRLAFQAPASIAGPEITLSFRALPWYAVLSTLRMSVAYALSMLFSLSYGYVAARRRAAERLLMPLLDVLQSVPILSFLPVVLLGLRAFLRQDLAAELTAVALIFTSQAWNLTYSFYQSLKTLPLELREATAVFRLDAWMRFKVLELPFAALGLIWNSVMSWAGGWFFLMAAESFTVGARDFRLPGLGSYLHTAANQSDLSAILAGLGTLVLVILLIDTIMWRPLLAWANKFKLDQVAGAQAPESWLRDQLSRSRLLELLMARVLDPLSEALDAALHRRLGETGERPAAPESGARPSALTVFVVLLLAGGALYGSWRAAGLLVTLDPGEWRQIGVGLLATFGRVALALTVAMAWTVPLGVAVGTNRRLATVLQPVVQVVASIPATALFPVVLLLLLSAPGGLNLAAVLLMLMGSQWYLLFNVIAGASAIPEDLRYTTDLLRLTPGQRWRTLLLPALFPYIVTGGITATGGAWNASIVAEHVVFAGESHTTVGIGAVIAQATASGNYALLLAATLAMVLAVVALNRTFWRWLYRLAEDRYRLD